MNKSFGFLERKTSTLMIVFSSYGVRIVFISKRGRQKMLKDKRVWFARVAMTKKGYSAEVIVDTIRRWWESMDEEELFQRLLNSPEHSKPVILFDNTMFINFNVKNGTAFFNELEKEILEQDD